MSVWDEYEAEYTVPSMQEVYGESVSVYRPDGTKAATVVALDIGEIDFEEEWTPSDNWNKRSQMAKRTIDIPLVDGLDVDWLIEVPDGSRWKVDNTQAGGANAVQCICHAAHRLNSQAKGASRD